MHAQECAVQPGYYQHNPRRATTGEIWRSVHPLLFPIAWVQVKFLRPGGRSYALLPNTTRDALCAREDIPPALRERMEPLVAAAEAEGFATLHWAQPRHGLNPDFHHQTAVVDLLDGDGILLRIIARQGHRKHGSNILIDQRIIAATSYPRGPGAILHTTTQAAYQRMPGVDTRPVRSDDPLVVISAHRDTLKDRERLTDRDAILAATDAYESAQWDHLIARSLWRHVCATRAELSAIIGEPAPAAEAPPRSDNPYAAPAAVATTAPALVALGADPRRSIQVRADLGTDVAEFTLADGKLHLSGQGEAEIADAREFSRLIDLMPRNGCGFRIRRTRKMFGIPLDFLRLVLADIDAKGLLQSEMRKRFLRAFWSPLANTAFFAFLVLSHMHAHGHPGMLLIGTLWATAIGLHTLANAIAWWRPSFAWHRVHVWLSLAYAVTLAVTAIHEGGFFLIFAGALLIDFLYGLAFVNLYGKIITADEERRKAQAVAAPGPDRGP